jgi:guanylate kinase
MPPNIARRGLLLVLSSPSGAGKTTLSRRLLAADAALRMSVSVTTRKPRSGEVDGQDYRFIDVAEFERMKAAGELLEFAQVHGKPLWHANGAGGGHPCGGRGRALRSGLAGGPAVEGQRHGS